MSPKTIHSNRAIRSAITLLFVAASGLLAQQTPQSQQPAPPQQPSNGGWRRLGDPPPAPTPTTSQPPAAQNQDPSEPVDRSDAYGQVAPGQVPQQFPQQFPQDPQGPPPAQPMPQDRPARPAYGLPPQVTLNPGVFVTIRINQPLSSDHNQPGDTFSGTLMQPVVADGIVVAQRGQTVYGRVSEAQKAHASNSSRLGLELTSLTLADGTQVPIRTQLVARQGGTTPPGVQAGTIAATTVVGTAVGAAADYGRATGAAIGAGAGAAAGIIGVLLTRNHPTVVYPETPLTFRVESPVVINTSRAPQAFRFVGPEEYNRPGPETMIRRPAPVAPGYYYGPGPYPYAYPYYPYYYGPSVVVGWGPGYFYGYGRGFRRW
ncbi:MAG TPA: hypothetical protein VKU19_18940 [Bryobacteraceae bacterium]|nr:hypothetical protein [Bryobacteraceae bacterium]